jgi:SAM-dependent methyltransferase
MHDTALEHARLFFELYWQPGFTDVIELGSQDVNGSLREVCPAGARYVGVDTGPGKGVDVVVAAGDQLPYADASFDIAVTSSTFEHDVMFWESFLELVRVLRPGGLLYLNAPSNSGFHRYPLDCWRFYPDAGLALTRWAHKKGLPVELMESFVAPPQTDTWCDFVAVFRRPMAGAAPPRGRIADHTPAENVASGNGDNLERIDWSTYDMRQLAARDAKILRLEQELRELRQKLPPE